MYKNNLKEIKKRLRNKHLMLRDSIPLKIREEKSQKIIDKIINSEYFKKSKSIFIFISFGSEVMTHDFIKFSIKNGKDIYVPYIDVENDTMKISKIDSFNDLEIGKYQILEPKIKKEYNKNLIDLCITPGVIFDKFGYRIGYGKGYYDRFFSNKNIKFTKIGICFRENYVDKLPHSKNDVPVNFVINY